MTESANRIETFGPHDPKTQLWSRILSVWGYSIPESLDFSRVSSGSLSSQHDAVPVSSLAHPETAQGRVRPTEVPLQVIHWSSSPHRHRQAQSASRLTAINTTVNSRTAEVITAAASRIFKERSQLTRFSEHYSFGSVPRRLLA